MNPLQKIQFWYLWIFKPHFLAGERAEKHFEQLSRSRGYILEKITQDRKSYEELENLGVKRGDYLVRNLRNLEIEVKCFTKLKYSATECYAIAYSHIKRHEEMVKLTGEPVVFAIFERNGRDVVENSLRMIPLRELTGQRTNGIFYDSRIKCVCIPLTLMYQDFNYFEQYKLEINRKNSFGYSQYKKPYKN
jgi:hypothetical protein